MIHIIIGTKAQFIKMAPVMKKLESRKIPYNFVNLGQHSATVARLAGQFGFFNEDFRVLEPFSSFLFGAGKGGKRLHLDQDISTLFNFFRWFIRLLIMLTFRPGYLRKVVFRSSGGVALIHGDTVSTFIGLLMAKRVGLKVAHIESGLRSWNFLHPFPEEFIRVVCMKYSDYLFSPSDEALENLAKMEISGQMFSTGRNTGIDAARLILEDELHNVNPRSRISQEKPYVLVSIHRFENLYSMKRWEFIINTIEEVSKKFKVMFVMHGSTEKKINKKAVTSQVSGAINYLRLQDYITFLEFIKYAEFVITDGGSVQEECYYLGKPCLIMRKRTERSEGIGENGVLGRFNNNVIENFVKDYKNFRRNVVTPESSPSDLLIDEVLKI